MANYVFSIQINDYENSLIFLSVMEIYPFLYVFFRVLAMNTS